MIAGNCSAPTLPRLGNPQAPTPRKICPSPVPQSHKKFCFERLQAGGEALSEFRTSRKRQPPVRASPGPYEPQQYGLIIPVRLPTGTPSSAAKPNEPARLERFGLGGVVLGEFHTSPRQDDPIIRVRLPTSTPSSVTKSNEQSALSTTRVGGGSPARVPHEPNSPVGCSRELRTV